MEQRGKELDSFKELVKKIVKVEDKAALRPRSYTCKTDQYCFQGSWLSMAKTSTQSQPIKDSKVEEPKSRPQESKIAALQHSINNAETSKQAWKEKKKKEKQEKRNQERRSQNSTPTTGANSTSTGKEKSKKKSSNRWHPSYITCWNCSKRRHYAGNCFKLLKPKN